MGFQVRTKWQTVINYSSVYFNPNICYRVRADKILTGRQHTFPEFKQLLMQCVLFQDPARTAQ